MSIEEEDKADSPEDLIEPAENTVDAEQDPPALSSPPSPEPPGDGVPCPQVKLGANGEIILDDTSLVLETTDAKKAKDFLDNSPVAIIESGKTTATNYGTWSRKRKHVDWSEKETLRFYKALSIVGSDFSMMESIFKKRTRQELKLKFKKEERLNGKMVDKCLRERGMYTELEGVMEDSELAVREVVEILERSSSDRGFSPVLSGLCLDRPSATVTPARAPRHLWPASILSKAPPRP